VCRVIRDRDFILEITRQSAIGPDLKILHALGGEIQYLPFISLRGVRPREYLRDRLHADRFFLFDDSCENNKTGLIRCEVQIIENGGWNDE
jgi:hypothetical protein